MKIISRNIHKVIIMPEILTWRRLKHFFLIFQGTKRLQTIMVVVAGTTGGGNIL